MWLNLCGYEAVKHKLKNRQKMPFPETYYVFYIPDGPVSFKCQGNRKEYCDAKHYILEGIGDISDSICKKVSGIHFPSHGLPKAQQDVQGVK